MKCSYIDDKHITINSEFSYENLRNKMFTWASLIFFGKNSNDSTTLYTMLIINIKYICQYHQFDISEIELN